MIFSWVSGNTSSCWNEFSNENCVRTHLYYNGLVLHRDISIENVIIMSQNDETVGRLIDLDHAKVVNTSATRMTYDVSHEDILLKDYLIYYIILVIIALT